MTNEAKIETGLTVTGSTELGKTLIEQAQEANRRELQQKVMQAVQGIMKNIRQQQAAKENAEAAIRVLNVRLEAIEKGNFTIDAFGTIQLNDTKLAPMGIEY